MKKKLAVGLTTAALLATCTGAAFAAPTVTVNGQALNLEQPPVIVESRTLVPMRAIFEALGCEVNWEAESKTVFAQKELDYLALTIGEKNLYCSNGPIELDVPAQIINDRTMVPLRAVSEALDAAVSWDASTETITVVGKAQGDYKYETKKYTENEETISVDMAYPQFIFRADADNTVFDTLNKQFAATARTRASAFRQMISEDGSQSPYTPTAQERFAVTYNQGQYFSVLFENVQNTGGAHPITLRNSAVYDMKTGKALALTDILAGDQKTIDQIIHDGFAAQVKATPEAFYPDVEKYLSEAIAKKAYGYYLTEKGLTIFFQQYEIAPYAAGFQEYTLPFSQTDAFKIKF